MGTIIFRLRVTLYTITLLSVSLLAVFIGLFCTIIGKRLNTNYYVARTFWLTAGPIMGWKFIVEGEEYLWNLKEGEGGSGGEGVAGKTGRSAVMVGNHQSFVDILYLGRIFPKHAAIMAKKSIRLIPGLGWFMLLSGTVFINRGNNKSAIASMTQAGDDMKRKRISLWIFPEGTRHLSSEIDMLPFKKGAFYLAVQSGVPIVPVVCQNYHHLFDGKTRFLRGTLRIKVLPPISTTGLTAHDVPELIERTRNAMIQTLRELNDPFKPSNPINAEVSESDASLDSTDALIRPSARKSKDEPYGAIPPQSASTLSNPANQHESSDESAVEETIDINGGGDDTGDHIEEGLGEARAGPGTGVAPEISTNSRPKSKSGTKAKAGAKAEGNATGTTQREAKKGGKQKKLAIAMISDFFLPVVGGVEGHIYSLSVELMRRGYRVIVITHHHSSRLSVRHLAPSPPLKVYHLPILPIASNATLPNYLLFLPYFRSIIHREGIDLIHGHGTLSSLAHEAIYHSHLLGVRSVFTDHSLFGFSEAVGVLTNKLLAGALRCVDQVICVSNTGRENTVLRAQLDPALVSVIPNALIADQFQPDPSQADLEYITIITISRLVHRKGIDLLVASAPHICALFPNVRFIVGGDGPKMVELEQMREKYQLQERVELLGAVRPGDVRGALNRAHIYLNTSLTEAFGISIIEAASAGLFVVATKVGGVPEILPRDMIEFARADEDDVIRALTHAIQTVQSGSHDPFHAHQRVKGMYAWSDVAERTEVVYERAMAMPIRSEYERLVRFLTLGPFFGPILCIITAVQYYFFLVLEWWDPREGMDMVEDFWDHEMFEQVVAEEKKNPVTINP